MQNKFYLIRPVVDNIIALVEWKGSYNLTGQDDSVIEHFEQRDGYRVIHDYGPHKSIIVIESDDIKDRQQETNN